MGQVKIVNWTLKSFHHYCQIALLLWINVQLNFKHWSFCRQKMFLLNVQTQNWLNQRTPPPSLNRWIRQHTLLEPSTCLILDIQKLPWHYAVENRTAVSETYKTLGSPRRCCGQSITLILQCSLTLMCLEIVFCHEDKQPQPESSLCSLLVHYWPEGAQFFIHPPWTNMVLSPFFLHSHTIKGCAVHEGLATIWLDNAFWSS